MVATLRRRRSRPGGTRRSRSDIVRQILHARIWFPFSVACHATRMRIVANGAAACCAALLSASVSIAACAGEARREPARRPGFEAASAGSNVAAQHGLKVAFLGDQGVDENARRVLQLVLDEHADAVVPSRRSRLRRSHSARMGYSDQFGTRSRFSVPRGDRKPRLVGLVRQRGISRVPGSAALPHARVALHGHVRGRCQLPFSRLAFRPVRRRRDRRRSRVVSRLCSR